LSSPADGPGARPRNTRSGMNAMCSRASGGIARNLLRCRRTEARKTTTIFNSTLPRHYRSLGDRDAGAEWHRPSREVGSSARATEGRLAQGRRGPAARGRADELLRGSVAAGGRQDVGAEDAGRGLTTEVGINPACAGTARLSRTAFTRRIPWFAMMMRIWAA
jgi:hypothetical protein